MSILSTEQRKLLERTVIKAREEAEKAARAALICLGVHSREPYITLTSMQRALRNKLRAEERRLGETTESQGHDRTEPSGLLVEEAAYAQWHRMLFARFMAENNLLMCPQGMAVTLEECGELAEDENEPDGFMLAARYAAAMLPGIFRPDDPTMEVRFDAAGRLALERLLNALPPCIFTADDSLGWVYQFWQTKRKEEVNKSGRKVAGGDISPVTQLFTEHYMVEFLLHNSLGKWWLARHPGEPLPAELPYLRLAEPAPVSTTPDLQSMDSYSDWPARAAELKILDPCCGSGHFLVAAFQLLSRMRALEEGLNEAEAGNAVLRDNLFGLELDPRCTQIAVFAVCLAAWKAGGYRALPAINVACSGLAVGGRVYEWTSLAGGDSDFETALRNIYNLFHDAPNLGSLIDPERVTAEENLLTMDWKKIAPLMEEALEKEAPDDPAAIFGEAAKGALRAAEILTGHYHLVITNVPYLGRSKQGEVLRDYLEKYHNSAKPDLATAFVERCLAFCTPGGFAALVTPQNWLFLGTYRKLRERLLTTITWNFVARLGPGSFEIMGWELNILLLILANSNPSHRFESSNVNHQSLSSGSLPSSSILGLDVSVPRIPAEKAELLRTAPVQTVSQSAQLLNPDARIAFDVQEVGSLLEKYAYSGLFIKTGDDLRFKRCFTEIPNFSSSWRPYSTSVDKPTIFGGRDYAIDWTEEGIGMLAISIKQSIDKWGVGVSQMRDLPVTLHCGDINDSNICPIIPYNPDHLPAIWAFCSSPEFYTAVRRIDQKLNVTNATLVKVPFDLERWLRAAEDQFPNGLPEPYSNDPTQWLFHGNPAHSTDPLQTAMARLLGYNWPEHGLPPASSGATRQQEDGLNEFAISDGILSLPPVAGSPSAVHRLRALLAAAYNNPAPASVYSSHFPRSEPQVWSSVLQEELLAKAGYGGRELEEWLRDGFFTQHCKLFHNRPFLWHIWDGRKDGFSAIVNYHKLNRAALDRLAYTCLGAWISAQRDADAHGEAGANARLVAALTLQKKLIAISEGENPYDIYVRWKPMRQQPVGWEPDINDGVRVNIRPFVMAEVLRSKFTINWNKDRGTNADGSERINDVHLSLAEKVAARRLPPPEEIAPTKTPGAMDL